MGEFEEVAGFWHRDPNSLVYRIIYQMNEGKFLATFKYSYLFKEYSLESFESYKQENEIGTYTWKCKKLSPEGIC